MGGRVRPVGREDDANGLTPHYKGERAPPSPRFQSRLAIRAVTPFTLCSVMLNLKSEDISS